MYPNFAKKLNIQVCEIKVSVQKIDGLKLNTFGIVITSFSIEDKEKKSRFFEKIFLLADISIDIALGISFLTFNNVEIDIISHHIH